MNPTATSDLLHALQGFFADATREAVDAAVTAAIARALPDAIRQASSPVYMTRREVVALTGWSARKLSYLQAQRRLPFLKRGRHVLFLRADVEAFLAEGYVPARVAPTA